MKAGTELNMLCPSYFAHGGAMIYSDLNHYRIAPDTDLKFELEVLECEDTVSKINHRNKISGNGADMIGRDCTKTKSGKHKRIEGSAVLDWRIREHDSFKLHEYDSNGELKRGSNGIIPARTNDDLNNKPDKNEEEDDQE